MDELQRLASDNQQLTKRVDDMSLRLAVVEKEQLYFNEKISDIKVLIVEKNNDLREDFTAAILSMQKSVDLSVNAMQKSIDTWNARAWWLISLVGGAVILAVLNLVLIRQG